MNGSFKVRCIKDYKPGVWLTKGKIYEFVGGVTTYDDGFRPSSALFTDYEDWYKSNQSLAACVELITDKNMVGTKQTIGISQKGRKVMAVLYDENGGYVQSAKAKYNPNDAAEGKPFKFEIGRNLAVKRLMEKFEVKEIEAVDKHPLTAEGFDWDSFKSSKFAVHCDTEQKAMEFLKECDVHGIVWKSGRKASESNLGATCYVHRQCNKGLTYGKQISRVPTIDYIPSIPTIKEVNRPAWVGEWVKILRVDDFTEKDHKVGDIFQVIKCTVVHSTNNAYYANRKDGCGYVDFGDCVVLENYHPEPETVKPVESPIPFVKAKVGDRIRIVKDTCLHGPELNIGDIHTVTSVKGYCICTDNENVLDDSDQEYIILEEEPKPTIALSIEIGDTIKVTDKGRTCDRYREFIEKYAKEFIAKYEAGYLPKNGDMGVVIGQGRHDYGGNYFVVLSNDKAFCISQKGIEKVQ